MGTVQRQIDTAVEAAAQAERPFGIANLPEPVLKNDPATTQPKLHKFSAAEDEVVAFFCTGVGVRAQSYETGSGSLDPLALLPAERATTLGRASEADRVVLVGQTLAGLPVEHREVLRLVYQPRRHPWLEFALTPQKDRGTFVWLATHTDRARAAWKKAFPDDPRHPRPETILSWIEGLGKALDVGKRLAAWMPECESRRSHALAAYEPLRAQRSIGDAEKAKARKQATRQASESYVDGLLDESAKRRARAFERKLGVR